jgi:hypothetical protein
MPQGRHRICNIEITEEQHKVLQQYLPYGAQKRIFGLIVSDFIEMLIDNPAKVIGGLLYRDVKLKDFLKGVDNGSKTVE